MIYNPVLYGEKQYKLYFCTSDYFKAIHIVLMNGETREEMYEALSKTLNPVKLLKLYQAEMNFNKRLLHEYKKGKTGNN